eukprot:1016520-Prymnesium_polylepis.2
MLAILDAHLASELGELEAAEEVDALGVCTARRVAFWLVVAHLKRLQCAGINVSMHKSAMQWRTDCRQLVEVAAKDDDKPTKR